MKSFPNQTVAIICFSFCLLFIFPLDAFPAPYEWEPYVITQPDGQKFNCYVSGDEYFNWIHDAEGYSIIQAADGYFCYADEENGRIFASKYRVGSINPESAGLRKWIKISREAYLAKQKALRNPPKPDRGKSPQTGGMNNIIIYIRFAGEDEIATTRQTYDNLFSPASGVTLKSYFQEVSYGQLTINSSHYPTCSNPDSSNASYQDSHPRAYFQPYDATLNPTGYQGDSERTLREHQLLADAVNWINANSPVPSSVNVDADGDGYVDNVTFMVKGNAGAWADLLWAHRWSLYSFNVFIQGKRVWDFTFEPENQVVVRTICHEMFHVIGAPDLYHYNDGGLNFTPVGTWDIMGSGGKGHMGAYMKWKYTNHQWINEIPEITEPGTYTLHPLTSSSNNCYKIASPHSSHEFFVLEYRKKTGTFEGLLSGQGLIIYRINTHFEGNANFDNVDVFDEVYVFRLNGTTTVNGSSNSAGFSTTTGRVNFNATSNPFPFLHDGTPGGISISNVGAPDTTISFHFDGFFGTDTQQIQLPQDWFIFSSYIKPNKNQMDSLFQNNTSTLSIVKDGSGAVYWPSFGVDMINQLQTGRGYQIKMTAPDSLIITGIMAKAWEEPIDLQAGWSILGYLLQEPHGIDTVLSQISSQTEIVKSPSGAIYWPQYQVNTIGNMIPGQGYQIKCLQATNLTYDPTPFIPFNRDDYLGSYICNETGYGSYPVHFLPDTNNMHRIYNDNFWDDAWPGALIYYDFQEDASHSISIPLQSFTFSDGITGTVSGSGNYNPITKGFTTVTVVNKSGYSYTTYHEFSR